MPLPDIFKETHLRRIPPTADSTVAQRIPNTILLSILEQSIIPPDTRHAGTKLAAARHSYRYRKAIVSLAATCRFFFAELYTILRRMHRSFDRTATEATEAAKYSNVIWRREGLVLVYPMFDARREEQLMEGETRYDDLYWLQSGRTELRGVMGRVDTAVTRLEAARIWEEREARKAKRVKSEC